jgi:multimeric flavodoxin WrbA
MNILIVDSSPHAKGNSVRLCDAFAQSLPHAASITRVNVAAKKIGPCHACNWCRRHDGACVQKDDMAPLYAAIKSADLIVLSTPVYWWGVSAQLKLFVDRWFALNGTPFAGKKLAVFAVGADPAMSIQHDLIKSQFRAICEYLKMDFIAYIPGSAEDAESRPVEQDAAALSAAAAFAKSL